MFLVDKEKNLWLGFGEVAEQKEAGGASLGILRNPPPLFIKKPSAGAQEHRAERYKGLAAARSILIREGKKHFPDVPTKYHRTTLCKHALTGNFVSVLKNKKTYKSFYDGLQTCGSVWTCPVCAAKVQEKRRIEIALGVDYFYRIGKQAVMITFTFPHQKFMGLLDLLLKQREAFKALRKGKNFDYFNKQNGYEGLIRSLEITYGLDHGWHPHTHELWFICSDVDQKAFIEYIKDKWKRACIKAGLLDENDPKQLEAFYEYSINIQFNCRASDYLAKTDNKDNLKSYWGVDREMAKATSKTAKKQKNGRKGMHPFQLAIDNHHNLFIEYVDAIKKTLSRQIFWSRYLKEKVGLLDKTDEEHANEEEKETDIFLLINKEEWYAIRKQEKRADVLSRAENVDEAEDLRSFILKIVEDNLQNE